MGIPDVICECGASDDDFNSTHVVINVKGPDYDFEGLKKKIGKAIKRILSRVGVVPPGIWPDIPPPLCVARHLQENLQYGDTYRPPVVTRADFLLGVIKFPVVPFVWPSGYVDFPDPHAVPAIQCYVSKEKPNELNISIGLGNLGAWRSKLNHYIRPPFRDPAKSD